MVFKKGAKRMQILTRTCIRFFIQRQMWYNKIKRVELLRIDRPNEPKGLDNWQEL